MRDKLLLIYTNYRKQLLLFVGVCALVIVSSNFGSLSLISSKISATSLAQDSSLQTLDLVAYQDQNSQSDSSLLGLESHKQVLETNESKKLATTKSFYHLTEAFYKYQPEYAVVTPHESNYGDRFGKDANGNVLTNIPIVVLHETVGSAQSAINTFRTNHPNDSSQVSYHALVALDGMIIYLVPPDKRAYGAGNSSFRGSQGEETVQTNPNLPSSVNNFAYHVSLETPIDGRGKNNNSPNHSGYTDIQYKSLAWLIAQSNIPSDRITTHKEVDRAGYKQDPRSFDFGKFVQDLHSYRQPQVSKISQQLNS